MSDEIILEGKISVEAAIRSGKRKIHKIYIKKNKRYRDTAKLEKWAKSINVKLERVKTDVINSMTSGNTHGGVIASVGERKFLELDDLLKRGKSNPFIVMIDGIEDPYNFGYAVRSLYAAGVNGVVVRPRNWMSAAGVVARSSAGATELMPMAIAETSLDAARYYKKQGLTVACTAKKDAISIYDADLSIPLFLVIGGEKRGITRSFIDKADMLLEIPYNRGFGASLAATSATSIIAFEALRQRKFK